MNLKHFFQWEQATRDTIDVKKIYVDMADDLVAGVLLSQIVYWFLPAQNGKTKLRVVKDRVYWLAKGREDWWDECRIKPRQFDTAFKKLEEKGLVEKKTMKFNGDPTVHIRILWDNFLPALKEELNNLPSELEATKEKQDQEISYIDSIQEQLDTAGFYKSVKTDSQDQTVGSTGFYKSVKTGLQNGDFVYTDFVKTLTENTTENTNINGWLGEATPSQKIPLIDHEPTERIKQEWDLVKDTCEKHDVHQSQAMEFYKVWRHYYPKATVSIVLATIREMLNDKWTLKNGKWTEQEYQNMTGLFHHRMKSWREMTVAYEDLEKTNLSHMG